MCPAASVMDPPYLLSRSHRRKWFPDSSSGTGVSAAARRPLAVRDGSLGSVFPATTTATTAANLTTTAPGPAVPVPNASYGSAAAAGPRSLCDDNTGRHAAAAAAVNGRVIFPLAADAEVHQAPAAAAATTAAAATEDLVGSEMLERVLRHRELFLQ